MKGNIVNYWRVVFGVIDTRYLAAPTSHETLLVHSLVLDLEDPHVFHAPVIRGITLL